MFEEERGSLAYVIAAVLSSHCAPRRKNMQHAVLNLDAGRDNIVTPGSDCA